MLQLVHRAVLQRTLCGSFIVFSSASCFAGTLEDNLDAKEFCIANNAAVSKLVLARSIIDAYKVPLKFVDWKDTGVTGYDEYALAVSSALCQGGASGGKCDDKNVDVQRRMVLELGTALSKAPRSGDVIELKVKFGSQKNGAALLFKRNRAVSELDRARHPILAYSPLPGRIDYSLPAQVFARDPDKGDIFSVSCRIAQKQDSPADNVSSTGPHQGSANWPGGAPAGSPAGGSYNWAPSQKQPAVSEYIMDHIRLRANTNDLDIGRSDAAFNGLAAASLAVNSDRIARKTTFDLHAVLGYVMPTVELTDRVTLASIPFLKVDRSFINAAKIPPNSDVENYGVGTRESLTFPVAPQFYSTLSFQPQYIFSVQNDAEIFKLNVVLEPQPLWPYFGYAAATGIAGLDAKAYVRGVMNIGHVTQPSKNPAFLLTNNYVQGGVQVGGSVFSTDPDSMFNGVSFPISYTYLEGLSGQFKTVHLFQAAANYTLPKTKYITIGLSYVNGRNLDTFEQQQVYKASLGIKY